MNQERFNYLVVTLQETGDLSVEHYGGAFHLTFEDFLGFTDDWDEIPRRYTRPDLVSELEQFFDETLKDDYYLRGEIFGEQYCVGYASFDI